MKWRILLLALLPFVIGTERQPWPKDVTVIECVVTTNERVYEVHVTEGKKLKSIEVE